MQPFKKLLLGAIAAVIVISAFAGFAAARRLEFSNQAFRIAFPTAGEPREPFTVSCPFTLEGSFHSRTLSKVSGSLIGYITRVLLAEASCRGGRARFLSERLPWHVRYESFSGTLPNITAINGQIIGWAILFEYREVPGITCLYLTTTTEPSKFILSREAGGVITLFRFDETAAIRKFSGSELCPASKVLFGATEFTVLGSTTRITVRLVA